MLVFSLTVCQISVILYILLHTNLSKVISREQEERCVPLLCPMAFQMSSLHKESRDDHL